MTDVKLWRQPPWPRLILVAAAAVGVGGGALLLSGVLLRYAPLYELTLGRHLVKVLMSVGFILLGTALWPLRHDRLSRREAYQTSASAAGVMAVAILMLAQYHSPNLFGLDVFETVRTHISPHLALARPAVIASFFALAAALLLLGSDRGSWLAHGLVLATAIIVLVAYFYSPAANRATLYPYIRPYTLLIILALAGGTLMARPDRGVVGLIASDSPGGMLVRRLLPFALGVPLLLGWFRLKGQLLGYYDTDFGVAVSTAWFISIFMAAVLWNGHVLRRSDRQRRRLEAALQQRESHFRALTENALDMVAVLTTAGIARYASPSHQRVLGYSPEELVGRCSFELIHPDDVPIIRAAFESGSRVPGTTGTFEYRFRHRDGTWRVLEGAGTNLLSNPVLSGIVVHSRDVTERRLVQDRLRMHAEQQAALIAFQQHAVASSDVPGLMDEAVRVVAKTLQVSHSELLQLLPDGKTLRLQAGVGWRPGVVGTVLVDLGAQRLAEVVSDVSVVLTDDVATAPPHVCDHGIVTGIRSLIRDDERGLGVLCAWTTQAREFTVDDRQFVHSIANVLAQAMQRRQVEARLQLVLEQMPVILWTTDAHLRLTYTAGAGMAPARMQLENSTISLADALQTSMPGPDVIAAHQGALDGVSSDYDLDWMGRKFRCHLDPLRDRSGNIIGTIGCSEDITERARTEEALRQSEERFFNAFEHAAIGMALVALDGHFFRVNRALCNLLGYSAEELLGKTFQDITHPDDLQTDLEYVRRLLADEIRSYHMEKRYLCKDGHVASILLSGSLVRGTQGDPLYLIGQIQDITEQKRVREALRESEQRFRAIADTAPVIIWTTDAEGHCTYLNRRWQEFRGRNTEQDLGHGWMAALHPDDYSRHATAAQTALIARRPFMVESRTQRADGEYRWLLTSGNPRFTSDGTFVGLIGSSIDLTERRQAEDAIRESEARYRTITENAYDLISEVAPNGQILYTSPNHLDVLGYEPGDLIGRNVTEFVHSEDVSGLTEGRRLPSANLPFRFRCKDGGWRWFECTGRIFHTSTQEPRWVVISRDVTERRQAQEQLRYQAYLLANINDAVIATDASWNVTAWNRAAETIFGWNTGEVLGRPVNAFLQTHSHAPPLSEVVDILHHTGRFRGEFTQLRKSGERFPVEVTLMLLHDADGRVTGTVGVNRDITDRKRVEQALTISERRLRLAVDSANLGLWDWNTETNEVYFSPRWKQQLGYANHELRDDWEEWASRLHPDDAVSALESLRASFTHLLPAYSAQFRMRHKDGSFRWILSRGCTVANAAGKPSRVLGLHIDITERKRAEDALRTETEKAQRYLDIAPCIILALDPDGRVTLLNSAGCDILECRADEVLGKNWIETFLPEALRQRISGSFEQLISRDVEPVKQLEHVVRTCKGKERIICWHNQVVRDSGGRIVGTLSSGEDITDRKRAEAAQQEYAERLRALSRRLLDVQETERRTLARELHDEIGQSLTAVRIQLQAQLRHASSSALRASLEDSLSVVDGAIQQVRNLSLDLRPSMLDDLGLVPALRWYVDRQARRAGLAVQLVTGPLDAQLTPEIESACFRIVQDALTNVMQHAQAQHVHIELRQRQATLLVLVRDDGIGFDIARQRARAVHGESMGLLSMEERAALVGGRLEITSGRGTEVRAWFPLRVPMEDYFTPQAS